MKKTFMILLSSIILLCVCSLSCSAETTVFGTDEMTSYITGLVSGIQPGTAGCSLKATAKCAELMHTGMEFTLNGADVVECVRTEMEKLDEEAINDLCDAVSMLKDACDCLTIDDPAAMLTDAGCDTAVFVTDPAAIGVIHTLEAAVMSLAAGF